jgi:starch-binding outer membrane protein, SusD/RagB family
MNTTNHTKRLIPATVLTIVLLLGSACERLDEKVYSLDTADNFYSTTDQVLSAWSLPYSFLQTMTYSVHFAMESFPTDEATATTKAGAGYENGTWERFHKHTWTSQEPFIKYEWSNLFQGIGYCNSFIEAILDKDLSQLNLPVSKEQMIAEVKLMRAFYYYWALSGFGNVPIVERVGVPASPPTAPRAEVFEFIEREILENIDLLGEKGDPTWYGRFTKTAAHALLAKLYLNAEVFTGTARWTDCIAQCDAIINSGLYNLDPTWDAPFKVRNEFSQENIFVIPFDANFAPGFNAVEQQLHSSHRQAYGVTFFPWNKIVTQESFYNLFKPNDYRINQWLVGPQFFDNNGVQEPLLDWSGQPLVITPQIDMFNNQSGGDNQGVRNIKYEIEPGGLNNMSNDLVIFRLSDIMFMKAESLMRSNGNVATGEAVNLINQVRARSFAPGDPDAAYTTATLTMDELLDERGREFAYEMKRREDLIRFGKFTMAWWEKPESPPTRTLFPIPLEIITTNKALVQNPGYE